MVRRLVAAFALVLASLGTGCLGGPSETYVRIEGDASPRYHALFGEAVREWNAACGADILAVGEGARLTVSFHDDVDEAVGDVPADRVDDLLDGSWVGQRRGDRIWLFRAAERSDDEVRATIAHELGHYLYGHNGHPKDATPSIMRVLGTEGRRMTVQPADVARVAANGFFCPLAR